MSKHRFPSIDGRVMARGRAGRSAVLSLALLTAARSAQAQAAPVAASFVELTGFYHRVTHDFGDWHGASARGALSGAHDTWYLEARGQEAFRDRGFYGSLSNVHSFSSRFFTQVGGGAGSGSFALPNYRLDASVGLKLGARHSLVLTGGGTYVRSTSVYRDKALSARLGWYARPELLLELGGRINWSNPGAVRTERVSGLLLAGRAGATLLSLSGGAGTEGYQLVGAAQALQRFRSQEAVVSWRQWVWPRFGFQLGGEWYHNRYYTRSGATLGFFHAW
jgi:YaiO family outer membrane protein